MNMHMRAKKQEWGAYIQKEELEKRGEEEK
jgi:hypothetical protein